MLELVGSVGMTKVKLQGNIGGQKWQSWEFSSPALHLHHLFGTFFFLFSCIGPVSPAGSRLDKNVEDSSRPTECCINFITLKTFLHRGGMYRLYFLLENTEVSTCVKQIIFQFMNLLHNVYSNLCGLVSLKQDICIKKNEYCIWFTWILTS